VVKLSEFFDPQDEMFDTAYLLVKLGRCHACGHKLRWKAAVSRHCLPYAGSEMWCSWECCRSGKTAKVDKRRERRMNRKFKDFSRLFEGNK
jgi:hypothetical protein